MANFVLQMSSVVTAGRFCNLKCKFELNVVSGTISMIRQDRLLTSSSPSAESLRCMQLLSLEESAMCGSSTRFSQPVLAAQPLRMKRKKVWCVLSASESANAKARLHCHASNQLVLICALVMQG